MACFLHGACLLSVSSLYLAVGFRCKLTTQFTLERRHARIQDEELRTGVALLDDVTAGPGSAPATNRDSDPMLYIMCYAIHTSARLD